MKVATVIPARYASSRLPGKPLSKILGKPMIQWVYERASRARGIHETWVATDDDRIFSAVEGFGGKVLMTSENIASGTDRVASVMELLQADILINVQGDEPLLLPEHIEQALTLVSSGRFEIGTLMTPFKNPEDKKSPHRVKVIADASDQALAFSRKDLGIGCQQHIGLYVYKSSALKKFTSLPQSESEKKENLEQLRAMDNGMRIGICSVQAELIGVDTPAELQKVNEILSEAQ